MSETQTTQGGVHGTYVPVIHAVRELDKAASERCKGIGHRPGCDRGCMARYHAAVNQVVAAWRRT